MILLECDLNMVCAIGFDGCKCCPQGGACCLFDPPGDIFDIQDTEIDTTGGEP